MSDKNSKRKIAYEKLYGRPLSEEEIIESDENLVGLFELLFEINKRLKIVKLEKGKNEN